MAKRNFKYNNTVDLSNIPIRNSKHYDWNNSIGCIVPFTFDNRKLCGEFKIIDYKTPEGLTHAHLYLEYNGNLLRPIETYSFKNAKINQILDEFYIEWAYEIGQHLIDENRNITIIDRFRRKDTDNMLRKYYKIQCNICGFDSGEHYIHGEYRNEWIVLENDLTRSDKRRINCPCCGSRVVVQGINDIPTTAPWMVDYFQGGYDEAKMYTCSSQEKKHFKCIHCNTVKKKSIPIAQLYREGLSCVCNDTMSYPNKFAYFLFEELKDQYDYYTNEYSPTWASNYRYDNYVIQNNKEIIFEFDGGIGHGNYQFRSKEKDVEGLKRDIIKEQLAQEHNIVVERVDCLQSTYTYMLPNIIKILSKYFDLSNIDFDMIEAKCHNNNFYKDICNYYVNTNKSVREISNDLNISNRMIYSALKTGNKFSWCNYIFREETKFLNEEKIIDYWNSHDCKTGDVSDALKFSQSYIVYVLKKANNDGRCFYDPQKEIDDNYKERGTNIYVYDKNFKLLKIYDNIAECISKCVKDFGVQFCSRCVASVCARKNKTHKGYIFSREPIKDKYSLEKNSYKTPVYIYDLKLNYLKCYNSNKEASDRSLDDFGVHFNECNIALVCSGKGKQHKGYIFSHKKLN